jgi:Tfp pilus assembly protein PilF
VKLPPLLRFSLKVNWSGGQESRLSPEWKSPDVPPVEPQALAMERITDGEFKILEALLLLRNTDTTPIALGLANPLLKHSETRGAAHEILGRSHAQLQIRTAAMEHFKTLLKEEKEGPRVKRVLNSSMQSLKNNDYEDAQILSPFVQKLGLTDTEIGNLPLALARSYMEQKDLQKAWDSLSRVPVESQQAPEARFLRAMIHYRSNDVPEARKELESLLLAADKIPKDLKSLSSATLAQIYFQQGLYKQAFETYRRVEQEHPIWMETLVESAWSQILNKDYEGAAGNMFSLHTAYFQGAYKPESYIVRTVSYLQLCQFGDAQAVLKDFLRKYKFAQKQLEAYKQQNPNHLEVIREFLKAGTPKKFAGLPRSLLVEIARDTKFIELQKRLNEIEEDSSRISKLTGQLDTLDQQFLQALNKFTKLLQDLEVHMKKLDNPAKREALLAEKQNHEKHILKNALLRKILADAKQGVLNEEQALLPFWSNRKDGFKKQQNVVLQNSFADLEKDLSHWLDQSELLFYEIHNGAGEHLRYQMASTDGKRAPTNAPKDFKKDDKDLKWDFDGEIWEDEVGHYRSSLKNVCPENETAGATSMANTTEGN